MRRNADTAIQNLLNAIQQGILTKSTKGRLKKTGSHERETENQDCLQEAGEAQGQRRVYDLLAPTLPQAGCAAEVPPQDAD